MSKVEANASIPRFNIDEMTEPKIRAIKRNMTYDPFNQQICV